MRDCATATNLLVSALQDRGISFKRENIESELANGSPQAGSNAQWVMEHLNPHTLLSKDEVALTKALERSGELEALLRQTDLASTRPLTEDELCAATATLKSSTAILARQIATLKAQLEVAKTLQTSRQEAGRDHDRYVTALNRQHVLEKQRTKAMAEDIVNEFESRMLGYQQQKIAAKKQLLQSVSSKLMNDDSMLLRAEKLAVNLKLTETDEQMEKRALDLISTLSDLTTEEVRCRLDRIYLEAHLTEAKDQDNPGGRDECLALEEDLESLYSEINVLAEMSARQEFGRPIIEELQKRKQSFACSVEANFDTILDLISNMVYSTKQDVDKILYHQSHCSALDQLSFLFKEEITDKQVGQAQTKKSHRRESSISSTKLQPPRTTQPQPHLPALENFLRRLGISKTPHGEISLQDMVSQRRSEVKELLHQNSKGSCAEMSLLASLSSSDEAMELLKLALQGSDSSQTAETSLVDQLQTGHLLELEKELTAIQKGIEDADLGILGEPDRSRDKFIEKWEQP